MSAKRPANGETSPVADPLSEKKKWTLTQESLDGFLNCLDADRQRAGEKYEHIRAGLVRFFQWRGRPFSEDCADETINRVARKIDQGEELRDIYSYVYGVARMVALEVVKQTAREQNAFEELPQSQSSEQESGDLREEIRCLKRCMEKLSPENRLLIRKYYQCEGSQRIETRRRLAEKLSIPQGALRLRALRLREKLQSCVLECVSHVKHIEDFDQ
ncbi:MAG TPA: hypothetical protein VID27_00285 [Blastocatellia bacterium]|jgi:RNA polymerase sigma factor (sigma-70 family)